MTNKDLFDHETEQLFASCDILLIKLYIKMEVICGFPDVSDETVSLLQELGLVMLREERCYITKHGRYAVNKGGVKNYLKEREQSPSDVFLVKRGKFLLEYPVIMGVLLFFLMLLCLLTWWTVSFFL